MKRKKIAHTGAVIGGALATALLLSGCRFNPMRNDPVCVYGPANISTGEPGTAAGPDENDPAPVYGPPEMQDSGLQHEFTPEESDPVDVYGPPADERG